MKEDFNHIDQLEHLMLSKSFSQLSDDEKEFVLSQVLSESEYNDMRHVLLQVKQAFENERAELHTPIALKESLLDKYKQTHVLNESKNTNRYIGRWVYYAAASVLLIISIVLIRLQWPEKDTPHLAFHEVKPMSDSDSLKPVNIIKDMESPPAPPVLNRNETNNDIIDSKLAEEDKNDQRKDVPQSAENGRAKLDISEFLDGQLSDATVLNEEELPDVENLNAVSAGEEMSIDEIQVATKKSYMNKSEKPKSKEDKLSIRLKFIYDDL